MVAVDHTVIPDRIEAATLLTAVAMAGGEITVDGARSDHMDMFIQKLGDMGVRIAPSSSGLWASATSRLHSVDVSTLPYPGIATDYKPLFVTMLSVADGIAIVTENLFAGRFKYVSELIRMGADIRTEGHHAVVRGVARLSGAPVRASDIRAGAALVLAGLAADGETVVGDAFHIERGLPGPSRQAAAAGRRRGPGRPALRRRDPDELVSAAAAGDRAAIGRLISLVERGGEPARRGRPADVPRGGGVYTVGITGAPGAGKSTLTDRLVTEVRKQDDRVGVLAIDPTSPYTGGAILGDRVRMQGHALDDGVFIRSMATRGHLGGLALATPEAVRVHGRGRHPPGDRRDGRGGPGRGRGGRGGRHHRGRRKPRVG